jgi:protein-L-isoaspartate(D-aspartate) O-methyltransferase
MKFDYKIAQKNMVDNQIRPSNVLDPQLLLALSNVPREKFVPAEQALFAYCEDNLLTKEGRALLSPRLLAKMIDGLNLSKADNVLTIASGFGYSAALMSFMCDFVVAVEKENTAEEAQRRLEHGGFDNVIVVPGEIKEGAVKHAPYDALLVEGGLTTISEELLSQVKVGGRIVAVFVTKRSGKCQLGIKTRFGIDWRVLFDANCPLLFEFQEPEKFIF